jgi:hypothetical protein
MPNLLSNDALHRATRCRQCVNDLHNAALSHMIQGDIIHQSRA